MKTAEGRARLERSNTRINEALAHQIEQVDKERQIKNAAPKSSPSQGDTTQQNKDHRDALKEATKVHTEAAQRRDQKGSYLSREINKKETNEANDDEMPCSQNADSEARPREKRGHEDTQE